MRGLARLIDQALQKWHRMLAQVQLLHRAAAHLDELHPEAVTAIGCLADESLPFQHNEQPVNRALVQAQVHRQLGRAELVGCAGQRVQNPERAFQDLNTVAGGNHGPESYQAAKLKALSMVSPEILRKMPA